MSDSAKMFIGLIVVVIIFGTAMFLSIRSHDKKMAGAKLKNKKGRLKNMPKARTPGRK